VSVQILLMPPLEDDKLPETEGVIANTGQVLREDPAKEWLLEVAAGQRP
jgi:hypothetical protein